MNGQKYDFIKNFSKIIFQLKKSNDLAKKTNNFSYFNSNFSHHYNQHPTDRSCNLFVLMLDFSFGFHFFKTSKKKKLQKFFFDSKIHYLIEFIH